jgi:hypothetical protein
MISAGTVNIMACDASTTGKACCTSANMGVSDKQERFVGFFSAVFTKNSTYASFLFLSSFNV